MNDFYKNLGFSARYCFYAVVDAGTKKIVEIYVAEKTMAEYSAKLEPYAANVILGKKILYYKINNGR